MQNFENNYDSSNVLHHPQQSQQHFGYNDNNDYGMGMPQQPHGNFNNHPAP